MFSVESAINYFVNRKFGFTAQLLPHLLSLQKIKDVTAEAPKELIEIEKYKKALRALPISELEIKYQQSVAQDAVQAKQNAIAEEKARFYNLQSANVDFVHWSKAAHWTLDEAIALSFGKEPEEVNWKKIEPLKNKTLFAKNYAKRRDLALRAACWKRFDGVLPPLDFLNWANELKIELPAKMIEEVSKIGGSSVDWHKMYLAKKAECDSLQTKVNEKTEPKQKKESTRKTENLLQVLAGVAIYAYGYKPELEKSTAPKEISDALSALGKKIDQKTVRTWLKEGIELLPANPHSD